MDVKAALAAARAAVDALPSGREVDAMRLSLLDVQAWWDCLEAVQHSAGGVDLAVPYALAYSEV